MKPASIPIRLWSSPGHRSKDRYPLVKRWLTFERRTYVSNAHVLLWARRIPYLGQAAVGSPEHAAAWDA